jgi:hypothetical protein
MTSRPVFVSVEQALNIFQTVGAAMLLIGITGATIEVFSGWHLV